jgi:hypothetical protein
MERTATICISRWVVNQFSGPISKLMGIKS